MTRHSKSLQELAVEPLDVALVQVPTYDVGAAVELGAGAECSTPQAVTMSVAAITEASRETTLFIETITKLYPLARSCSRGRGRLTELLRKKRSETDRVQKSRQIILQPFACAAER